MTVSRFHVPAMDCAAEEQLIRMALDGRDDIARIEFDSQQRDVLIEHRSTADAIREVLEPLGLGARHVDDTSHMNTETDPTREAGPHIDFGRNDRGVLGHEEDVVERERGGEDACFHGV